MKGSADLLGFTSDGKILCIEVKTGKARQSKYQKLFEWRVKAFGGRYVLVRDEMAPLIAFLDSLCLPLPDLTI